MTVVDQQADMIALAEIEVAEVDHDHLACGLPSSGLEVDHQVTHYV